MADDVASFGEDERSSSSAMSSIGVGSGCEGIEAPEMELADATHIRMDSHVGWKSSVEKPGEAGVEPRHVGAPPRSTSITAKHSAHDVSTFCT